MTAEDRQTVNLAIGRILRIASRPTQPGDAEEYERCRRIAMSILKPIPGERANPPLPGWNFGSGSSGRIE